MRCALPTRTAGSEARARHYSRSMSDGADAPHLEELRARAPALHAIALITTLDSGVATAAVTAALVRLLSQRHDPELQAGEAARRALDGALADLPGIASQSDRGLPLDRVDADDLGEGLDLLRVTTRALTALDPVQRKVLAAWAYDDVALDPGAEIGRASCRERVSSVV